MKLEEIRMTTELKNILWKKKKKKTWKNCNGRESQKEQEGEIKTKKDIKERKN